MCMIDGCENDRVHGHKMREAKKAHTCEECGRQINAGETYRYTSGIDSEGEAFDHKACAHCNVCIEWLLQNCGGWVRPMVAEEIREHTDEYRRHFSLMRTAVGIERKWRRLRSDQLMQVPAMPKSLKEHIGL